MTLDDMIKVTSYIAQLRELKEGMYVYNPERTQEINI